MKPAIFWDMVNYYGIQWDTMEWNILGYDGITTIRKSKNIICVWWKMGNLHPHGQPNMWIYMYIVKYLSSYLGIEWSSYLVI